MRKSIVSVVLVEEPKFKEQSSHLNQYSKNIIVMGWMSRFCDNAEGNNTTELNGSEVKIGQIKTLQCMWII